MLNICVCGGGNLGHVTAGFLAAQDDVKIAVLTRRPEMWSSKLEIVGPDGTVILGKVNPTSDAEAAMPDADIAILCLPGFAIRDELLKIRPFLNGRTKVGAIVSSTGFFFEALELLPETTPLFGFQRVPFICRTIEYGYKAELKGYKASLSMAVERLADRESFRQTMEKLFKTPVKLLNNYYEASLSNSNPLLHTARLYTMFRDWYEGVAYERNPQFYSEWTDEASELYILMDNEFQKLLEVLPVERGSIPPVLSYYECNDIRSLTLKLRQIQAFKGICSPMVQIPGACGYMPDFTSRYFTEDIPFGMRFIVETAGKHNVDIPIIRKVYRWGLEITGSNIKP